MRFLSDRKVDTPTSNAEVMLAFYKVRACRSSDVM